MVKIIKTRIDSNWGQGHSTTVEEIKPYSKFLKLIAGEIARAKDIDSEVVEVVETDSADGSVGSYLVVTEEYNDHYMVVEC